MMTPNGLNILHSSSGATYTPSNLDSIINGGSKQQGTSILVHLVPFFPHIAGPANLVLRVLQRPNRVAQKML